MLKPTIGTEQKPIATAEEESTTCSRRCRLYSTSLAPSSNGKSPHASHQSSSTWSCLSVDTFVRHYYVHNMYVFGTSHHTSHYNGRGGGGDRVSEPSRCFICTITQDSPAPPPSRLLILYVQKVPLMKWLVNRWDRSPYSRRTPYSEGCFSRKYGRIHRVDSSAWV